MGERSGRLMGLERSKWTMDLSRREREGGEREGEN